MTKEEYMDQIKKVYDTLPDDIQQVIVSSDYQQKLFEIAKKTKLNVEQLGNLEIKTTMVLLGLSPFDDYELDVEQSLGIHDEALDELIELVNKEVFRPVRESLKEIHPREDEDVLEEISDVNVLGQDEKDILRKAGVETENVHQVPVQAVPKSTRIDSIVAPNKAPSFTTNNIPQPVTPDPRKTIPTNPMFADRLNKPVQNTPKITDHSVPQMTGGQSKSHDPYREAVE